MLARFEEDRPMTSRRPKLTALLITFALVAGACSPSAGGSPPAPPQACGAAGSAGVPTLLRERFRFIIGTSFGYMGPIETVAGEFPDITYRHLTGFKSNGKN